VEAARYSITRNGVTFIRDSADSMFDPDTGQLGAYKGIARLGGVISLVTMGVADLLFGKALDAWWTQFGVGIPVEYVLGALVAVIFVVLRDSGRVAPVERRGTYVGGVFLFADALLVRHASAVTIIPRTDVVRFEYAPSALGGSIDTDTWCIHQKSGSETAVWLVFGDSVGRFEAWRQARDASEAPASDAVDRDHR